MADFHQSGVISTFHRLGHLDLERMEKDLVAFSKHRPIALVLPITPVELRSTAAQTIRENLREIAYIDEIVITLGRTTQEEDFLKAREFFSSLPQNNRVIWASGPSFSRLYGLLAENDLQVGDDGKGRSAWVAYGYILACEKCKVIALHDCDIVNHSRELVGRLCYPVASPTIDYAFCKGYYARVTDRMHGRVTRLFVTPLIRSLEKLFGCQPLLRYLDSFRYPLAGEFSMVTDLAAINRIPNDWGLEVETLAEVFRNYSLRRICQAELTETYEHKHQALSAEDPKTGLMKMAIDIAKSVFRNLAIEGIILGQDAFGSLLINYQRTAKDMIQRYRDDAAINGLGFDYHQESIMVEAFTRALQMAGRSFFDAPLYSPLIPSWNRVISAVPYVLERVQELVEKENAG